jgi:uncharacterized protein (DUF433 family)
MMSAHLSVDRRATVTVANPRELLLREAVVLAEIPENRVRKDIEHGHLSSPWVFKAAWDKEERWYTKWSHVFMLAAVYSNDYLNGRLRRITLEKVDDYNVWSGFGFGKNFFPANDRANNLYYSCKPMALELDKYLGVYLKLDEVCANVSPRVNLYADGLHRIEEKKNVLGGEAVFKNTRLSVTHIGKMRLKGEPIENILENYPYLSRNDVEFAVLYYRAHPPAGRPRILSVEVDGGNGSGTLVAG